MKIKYLDLNERHKLPKEPTPINPNDYCFHGNKIKDHTGSGLCICCKAFIPMELENYGIKFCRWCLENPIKKEFLAA